MCDSNRMIVCLCVCAPSNLATAAGTIAALIHSGGVSYRKKGYPAWVSYPAGPILTHFLALWGK